MTASDSTSLTDNSLPVALLVGASSGLGAALALALAGHYHLILLGKSQARLEVLDDQLRTAGYQATLIPVDLSQNHADIGSIVAGIWQRFDRLDLLVGLAATTAEASPLAHLDPQDFQRMMTVNCHAHFCFLRAADALLRQAAQGRVLMIGGGMVSRRQDTANPFTAGFDASKSALEHLTLSYSRELHRLTTKAGLVIPYPFKSRLRTVIFPGQPDDQLSSATQQAKHLATSIINDDWANGDQLWLDR